MKANTKLEQPPPSHLAYATLALAGGAFLLGVYAIARPAPSPATKPGLAPMASNARDPQQVVDELTRLRREVDALNASSQAAPETIQFIVQRLSTLELAVRQQRGVDGGLATLAPAPVSTEQGRPMFKELKVSNAKVTIKQLPDRSFAVTNADPALTGTPVVVEGRRSDGSIETYTVIVPAPGTTLSLP
jgi:hypothetical protein